MDDLSVVIVGLEGVGLGDDLVGQGTDGRDTVGGVHIAEVGGGPGEYFLAAVHVVETLVQSAVVLTAVLLAASYLALGLFDEGDTVVAHDIIIEKQ